MSDEEKPVPGPTRRVRRRTGARPARPAPPSDPPTSAAPSQPRQPVRDTPEPRDSHDLGEAHRDSERGVRALIASGPSQISRIAAMRTRDINRPTDEDLATAEAEVEIVQRNWKPPAR